MEATMNIDVYHDTQKKTVSMSLDDWNQVILELEKHTRLKQRDIVITKGDIDIKAIKAALQA